MTANKLLAHFFDALRCAIAGAGIAWAAVSVFVFVPDGLGGSEAVGLFHMPTKLDYFALAVGAIGGTIYAVVEILKGRIP